MNSYAVTLRIVNIITEEVTATDRDEAESIACRRHDVDDDAVVGTELTVPGPYDYTCEQVQAAEAAAPQGFVKLRCKHLERFPHFIVEKGITGTLVRRGDDFGVVADTVICGCEEWLNEIDYTGCEEMIQDEWEVIQ